jgi:exodeoxyribonuclease V beta subunit
MPWPSAQLYRAPTRDAAELEGRSAQRAIAHYWRNSSFSGLTRDAPHAALELRDRDAHSDDSQSGAGGGDARSSTPILLDELPRGAHAGLMLHHIFEHLDFQEGHPGALRAQVERSLALFGFDPERWGETLGDAYAQILATPLSIDNRNLRLAELGRPQRLDELEFHIPVREERGLLNSAMLADLLRERSTPPWSELYPDRVHALGFEPLAGFLKGYMDLVFVHDGRWYLVDYKSNYLGDTAGDYAQPALTASMEDHHYFLQYHIYLVALHRYLRLRVPDYDYERHMGGVFYLYLRGMHPSHPAGSGVFADRPSARQVERWSATFDRAAEEAP